MINALVETPVDSQKFFQILPNRIDGIDVLINRAGFTGEKLGFEIIGRREKYYIDNGEDALLMRKILK